jgi:hypothetical protein
VQSSAERSLPKGQHLLLIGWAAVGLDEIAGAAGQFPRAVCNALASIGVFLARNTRSWGPVSMGSSKKWRLRTPAHPNMPFLTRGNVSGAMHYEGVEYVVRASLGRDQWTLLIYFPDRADSDPTVVKFSGSRG